jgi:hypothetical protein
MSEMGSHDPFEHLKHKLWPKERPGVKLVVWLLTTKVRNWLDFLACRLRAGGVPHTVGKLLMKATTLLRLHINQRSAEKVMGPQSRKSPKFGNFETPKLEVPGQNAIWIWASWRGTEYTIRGKVVASPKSRPWWVLWVRICPWLVLAPKVLKLTNLLFGLCRSVWVIKHLSFFLVPSWSSSTPLYPQSVTSQGVCPDSLLFHYFHFKLTFESTKDLGAHQIGLISKIFLSCLDRPHLH